MALTVPTASGGHVTLLHPLQMKHKVGFMHVEGAIVELDYTSQMNKDIQKRRKHLFRILLPNRTEYLVQAPSDSQRTNW